MGLFLTPIKSNAFNDYFVRCPKSVKSQTDRSSIQKDRKLTFDPQTTYVFLGKYGPFAEKAKALLPEDCGKLEIPLPGQGERCDDCKNPYAEMYEKYKSGEMSDSTILEKLFEVNSGNQKDYLRDLIQQKKSATTGAQPASAPTKR